MSAQKPDFLFNNHIIGSSILMELYIYLKAKKSDADGIEAKSYHP